MLQYRKRDIAIAVGASALAGFVDVIGFLSLGGFFVSFMSGNSTRLAAGVAGVPADALIAARLILAFVLGVVVGSLIGGIAGKMRPPVLFVVIGVTLVAASVIAGAGAAAPAMILVAAAMGAENTTFERNGEVSIGLTYMTGTLVKFGQRLAGALTGGPRLAWLPYALLWAGLALGAIIGANAFPRMGLSALWIAAAGAFALALITWMMIQSDKASAADTPGAGTPGSETPGTGTS